MMITCKPKSFSLFYSIYYLCSCFWSSIFWSWLVLTDTMSWYLSWSQSQRPHPTFKRDCWLHLNKCPSMIFPSSLGFASLSIEFHNCVCVLSYSSLSFSFSVYLMQWEVYMGMLPFLPFSHPRILDCLPSLNPLLSSPHTVYNTVLSGFFFSIYVNFSFLTLGMEKEVIYLLLSKSHYFRWKNIIHILLKERKSSKKLLNIFLSTILFLLQVFIDGQLIANLTTSCKYSDPLGTMTFLAFA